MLGTSFILVVVASVLLVSDVCGLHCNENQVKEEERCCDMCPKGTRVTEGCSTHNPTTKCSPCESGSYTKNWNYRTQCTKCTSTCGQGRKISENCTSISDVKCECISPNTYFNTGLDYCMPCKSCIEGTYPFKPCTKKTTCHGCPMGTFSNVSKNYRTQCSPCSKCQKYKKDCTRTSDAVCDETTKTTTTTTTPTTLPTTPETLITKIISTLKPVDTTQKRPTEQPNEGDATTSFWLIILSVVSVIVVMVAVAACLYFTKRKGECHHQNPSHISLIEESGYERLNTGILLRDLSCNSSIILGLHRFLNPDGAKNWRDLAGELKFDFTDIANFGVNRGKSAEEMLATWQTKQGSTVDLLHKALLKIGRCDAAVFVADRVKEVTSSNETTVV